MLLYRPLQLSEAERITEIDATHFIRNAWRKDASGEYRLTEINWTDKTLPNGLPWHLRRFREALRAGGVAFGCLDGDRLLGYATVWGSVFGQQDYVLLDQLFVSAPCRGKGIGKALFALCAGQARRIGGKKLYLCAGSAENTIAFYHALGCVPAVQPDPVLAAEDPRDIQMEYLL